MPVVGVPKTIDNDLTGTDYTFGFDTAVNVVMEAVDRLHSTAESHHRIMVVEVMGRDSGWIAAIAGIAGGADYIIVPEQPYDLDALITAVTGFGGLAGFMAPLWVMVGSLGLSFPNAPAAALSRHGEAAGTASAMLGASQFVLGGLVAPLVGALDNGTPVPMAAIMVSAQALAGTLLLVSRRSLREVR